MMKTYLKRAFQLSDSGVKGLAKSIWSFFLYYVSFVPPMICVFLFADRLLNGNTGKPVVYLLFMLAATLVMYLVINYNYKTTYDETYQESANLRINLAEQLSKLPLSYFSKHNLSDLAQTIMADVASIEHAFANAVANSIGFAIYFLVISVALLIMNWKLGLCVLLPVLTSASVLFLTKKLQVRDVNKHYDKLRDISESFQNAIELNQEIKSYGLKEKVEAQMDQQLDESENLQWKAQITQTIPVTIGQTLSIGGRHQGTGYAVQVNALIPLVDMEGVQIRRLSVRAHQSGLDLQRPFQLRRQSFSAFRSSAQDPQTCLRG